MSISVLRIPFSLSEVIPNPTFLNDLIIDQNFLIFLGLGESGSELLLSNVNISETYFQYASLNTFCTCALMIIEFTSTKVCKVMLLLICCLLLLQLWESVIVLCFAVRYFMSILVLQSS